MFTPSEEESLLQDAARGFVQDKMPTSLLRRIRDQQVADGFDRSLWKEMAEMGWLGVVAPEALGGAGMTYKGLGLILEETGRTLAPSPLLSTAMIGVPALCMGADEATKTAWLPKVLSGDCVMAFAVDEGGHHAPARIAARLEGGKVSGRKTYVADGQAADLFIVAARDSTGALVACLVRADAAGVTRKRLSTVDGRGAADVTFDGAAVEAVLAGTDLVERLLDRARIGLACEMVGQSAQAFELTTDYLRTRTQFGQLIGSFQALQHRASKMFVELELTRSCVTAALDALDNDEGSVPEMASLAKGRACETLHLISNETVQMHGGIGMTDAHDSGLYLKRARVAEALYGGSAFHRDRYAGLNGF